MTKRTRSPVQEPGPDPVDMAIGARIRMRRKELRIAQKDLAKPLGVSFQQIQKYERGANRVSGSTLVAMARALMTTVGWLVGEEGAQHSSEVLAELDNDGAVELLRAYKSITRPGCRTALLDLARVMGEEDEGTKTTPRLRAVG